MRRICKRVTWLAVLAALSAFAPRQANAQLVISVDEENLYVQHMDVNTTAFTELFRPDESTLPPGAGTDGPEGIAADESNRVFYWQDQARLYRTFFDLRDTNGFMVSEYIADMQCTTCTSITTMDGLTYANGTLYGVRNSSGSTTGPEGIYSIDVATGAATLILDFTTDPGVGSTSDIDVRSIAYNSADGLFYIFNNDNSTGFSGGGAGIYTVDIDNVLGGGANAIALVEATPDVTLICSGCGTSTTPDIDGMAIGDGKLYLTIDQPGDILAYDLATNLFDPSFTNPWAASELAAGATWAPSALAQPAGVANLRNALAVTTNGNDLVDDGNVGLGDQIVYTLTNENQGSEVAGSMMYEIEFTGSASVSVASAVGGLSTPVINGNTVTGVLAPFAINQPEMVTITVDTLGAGFVTATASVQPGGAFPDPFQLDNTKTHTAEVRDFPYVDAICYTERLPAEGGNGTSSTIFGHPSLGGVFQVSILTSTNTIIRPPYASPDGRYVGFVVTTTLDDTINDIIVLGEDGVFSAVAQQAVTTAPDSMLTLDEFILHPRLIPNNNGHFAINAATTSGNNRGIFEWTGTGFTTLVQTGDAIPAFNDPGITYGDTSISWGGVNFDGSGRFGTFLDFVDGLTSGQDQLLLANSGLSLLAHSETNGPMGTAETWNDAFNDDTYWLDGAGFDWIVQGGLTGSTLSDGVIVVNNQIVIQEDSVIAGLTSNTSTLEYAQMAANGEWFAYGSTDDATEDWMVKGDGTSFSLLAKGGDPVYPGAPDNWDDATGQPSDSFSQGFHFVASNTQGDYVITGRTDRANRRKNTVCVLNGTTEILREGDPIDVDGNGMFDDNRYVRTFDEHTAVLTPSGDFYCVVDMTDTT
ncbi:MAG: hypothetical protein KDA33_06365, partial [Phycisphaerales bacterium]|nr:hypothetical protein [Phycisphaerales bacterium]